MVRTTSSIVSRGPPTSKVAAVASSRTAASAEAVRDVVHVARVHGRLPVADHGHDRQVAARSSRSGSCCGRSARRSRTGAGSTCSSPLSRMARFRAVLGLEPRLRAAPGPRRLPTRTRSGARPRASPRATATSVPSPSTSRYVRPFDGSSTGWLGNWMACTTTSARVKALPSVAASPAKACSSRTRPSQGLRAGSRVVTATSWPRREQSPDHLAADEPGAAADDDLACPATRSAARGSSRGPICSIWSS